MGHGGTTGAQNLVTNETALTLSGVIAAIGSLTNTQLFATVNAVG